MKSVHLLFLLLSFCFGISSVYSASDQQLSEAQARFAFIENELKPALAPFDQSNVSTSLKCRRAFRNYAIPVLRYGGLTLVAASLLMQWFTSEDLSDAQFRHDRLERYLLLFEKKMQPEEVAQAKNSMTAAASLIVKQKGQCRTWRKVTFWSCVVTALAWAVGYCGDVGGWWPPEVRSYVINLMKVVQSNQKFNQHAPAVRNATVSVADAEIIPTGSVGNCFFESVVPQLKRLGITAPDGTAFDEHSLRTCVVAEVANRCRAELAEVMAEREYQLLDDAGKAEFIARNAQLCSSIQNSLATDHAEWVRKQYPRGYSWDQVPHMYQQRLGQSYIWAGDDEARALASVLNTTVYTFNQEASAGLFFKGGKYQLRTVYGNSPQSIALMRNGNHYEGWQPPQVTS